MCTSNTNFVIIVWCCESRRNNAMLLDLLTLGIMWMFKENQPISFYLLASIYYRILKQNLVIIWIEAALEITDIKIYKKTHRAPGLSKSKHVEKLKQI